MARMCHVNKQIDLVGIMTLSLRYAVVMVLYSLRCVLQENLNRLFKEIVQFSPGALQNGGGSGLGLWSEYPGTINLSSSA